MNVAVEIPPLRAGDRMTRDEFMRRWENEPGIKRAELIGGIVYMPSPLSVKHGDTESDVGTWIGNYRVATPGTASGHNSTTFLLDDSPQPDVNLRILPEYHGSSWVDGKYLGGAPELLVEFCFISVAYDLHEKRELYEQAKVQEYLAVLPHVREIRWHRLLNDSYQLMPADADGIWRSKVFPGLWLDAEALFAQRLDLVLAKLAEGLASPEHRDFKQMLVS